MDPLVHERIAQLAELGTQSPLHAVRAIETINRLAQASPLAQNSAANAISRIAYAQGPMVAQQMDVMPNAYGLMDARSPAAPPGMLDASRAVAPTQYPPVMDARNHPPSYAQTIQPMMAPTLYLTVANIPSLIPGQESPGERLDFSLGDGILIGMRGTVLSQDLGGEVVNYTCNAGKCQDALIGLKLTINGQEQLIVDGESESWAWYSDLFTPSVQWTPIQRRVVSSDILQCRFLSRAIVGGPTLTPSLMFAYRRLPMPI